MPEDLKRFTISEDYLPEISKLLLSKIANSESHHFVLIGFSVSLKWISRILSEQSINFDISDMRQNYYGYDCCNKVIKPLEEVANSDSTLVICHDEPSLIKSVIFDIANSSFSSLPVIYDTTQVYNPLRQDFPYSKIFKLASSRAKSMLCDSQLLDLIQLVRSTSHLSGAIVEFGSLYGGSGAVIAEAANYYDSITRDIFLCDTFSGIPSAKLGCDKRWNSSFSDNSYVEVKNAFSDLQNVQVLPGNILETCLTFNSPLSFVYVASDTYESAKIITEHTWQLLQPGGIMHVCDFGSYPNCLPITCYYENFIEQNPGVKFFLTSYCGIYFIKP